MKIIYYALFAFAVYHFILNPSVQTVSASEIDPSCDVVIFTTASCPYCIKAKKLLANSTARWCEKDINKSSENRKLFKSLGGRGVPLAVIGDEKVDGFRKDRYIAALDKILYR